MNSRAFPRIPSRIRVPLLNIELQFRVAQAGHGGNFCAVWARTVLCAELRNDRSTNERLEAAKNRSIVSAKKSQRADHLTSFKASCFVIESSQLSSRRYRRS
jgi:hypothetical protein